MKSILKYLFAFIFVTTLSFSFASCSDDEPGQDPDTPGTIVDGKWTEKGNQLIYTESYDFGYGVSYTATWTLTFNGDVCVKSICACKFSSSEYAEAFYQAWKADETYPATKSGNTVTIDYTEAHKDLSKSEIKNAIGSMGGL